MVDKNKPLGKVEKVFVVLFFASCALLPIGIVVIAVGPAPTTKNISLAQATGDNATLQLVGTDSVHCSLTVYDGDKVTLWLFDEANYNEYVASHDTYGWGERIENTNGSFWSNLLSAGNWYIVVYNDTPAPTATGSFSYWLESAKDNGETFFAASMILAFVGIFATVCMLARRGHKVKVWDPRQGKYV